MHPLALRARVSLFLSYLLSAVFCQPITVGSRLDNSSPAVRFTPDVCNNGVSVSADQLPTSCNHTWFITPNQHGETVHATRAAGSRAVLQFQASGISWFSAPVTELRGTADIFLDDVRVDRVRISPYNSGPVVPTWSRSGLDSTTVHNLTIVSLGDDIISVDSFALIIISESNPAVPSTPPVVAAAAAASNPDSVTMKDASSGAVISVASLASVAVVVVICGGCFLLGKRRKSPGFHMPTVLVDIDGALDEQPEPPSPTTIRAWRASTHKSMAAAAAAGEPTHDRYPPSRPPSYRSAKDSLYRSDSTSQDHEEGHWR